LKPETRNQPFPDERRDTRKSSGSAIAAEALMNTAGYASDFLKSRQALTPPNPKEFDSATLTATGLALCGI